MKLARNVVAPAILLGLCVGLAGGCGPKKPPGTNPPGETGGSDGGGGDVTDGGGSSDGGGSADGGGGDVADGGGDDGGNAGGGAPAQCGAKVSDTPTLLFNDLVIMRAPPGVEFIQDGNPTFVQAMMSGGFMSTCDAIIKRVMISLFKVDKKKKASKVADEMVEALASQGYTDGKKSGPFVDTGTDYHIAVEYAGGGGSEATVLYIAVARRDDTDFVVIFESAPADYAMLKPTYEESAKSLFIVPQE